MRKLDAEVTRRIGYEFEDRNLLEQALTHRSFGKRNNERLEFLGDAILGFVMAEILYRRFPHRPEGELTRLRASMVRGETLAAITRSLDIAQWIRLGPGELKSGGFRRESILADILEALLGAIYLDGGMEACQDRIRCWFGSHISALPDRGDIKDPKSRLQEYLQARNLLAPEYAMVAVSGDAHAQTFHVRCAIPGLAIHAEGFAHSRRGAEQAAAREALGQIEGLPGSKS